ncbi:hypothetical protein [uncultured Tateyamaria sp.]|uniref:hypothetical protein n=1 Tax=uncultured Tateyamaria sp. TaxID=455651 RepID=UPI00261FABE7|nr:hypothetical protein [uncultured Tateyamaria sp.]
MKPELITHKRFIPAFGLAEHEDQMPVCLYTILSVNKSVGDCAAYEGIGPTMNGWEETDIEQMTETIKAGGSKISEEAARKLFDEIEDLALRYRG